MKREAIAFAISGVFFGLIVGWIVGSQQRGTGVMSSSVPTSQSTASTPTPGQTAAPPPLDENRVRTLRGAADQNPKDVAVRVELGNLYFDAERYSDAIAWYREALGVDPANVNASTDLAIAYYYTNQIDQALAQFERSLEIDPVHTKTLLNLGIVRAFGKQDLKGAAEVWERVIALAPDSPEGKAAKQALDNMRGAHPDMGGVPPGPPGGPPED